MKFKIILPIVLLSLSVVSSLHYSYAAKIDTQSLSTQIDKPFINEWAQYQSVVLINQLEKFNLQELAIELDRVPNEQKTLEALNLMLQQPKNSISRLEKLQLKNAQLKELIQLNIQEYKFDLHELEQDFGSTEVEYDNDEYMNLSTEKYHNFTAFNELRSIVNQQTLSMILHTPLSSQNKNDNHINLVNDWFRYQNALNKIDELEQQIDATSTQYLKQADDAAKKELKQKIDQYPNKARSILQQVQPKSPQVTEQIKQLNASLQLTSEYLKYNYAMRGIDGLIETSDYDQSTDRSLTQEYFELTRKLKKDEYQIEEQVLSYLKNNPLK